MTTWVYSYIRFSSKAQMDGDSYRRQFEGADLWLRQKEQEGFKLSPMRLHDLGVSAFRGRNKHSGALKKFVDAVDDGKVRKGSVLLVEHLDRLSREAVAEAFSLFLSILNAGVRIVVLQPYEIEYTRRSVDDITGLMLPLIYFHLAHIESQNKSFRLKKVWGRKRQSLTEGAHISRRCPSWLTWDEKKSRFVENEGALAVRYIYERTAEGFGQRHVLKDVQRCFKPIGRSGRWNGSFIQKILSDRSVIGEYQPHMFGDDGKLAPVGGPINDYYPAVVAEDLFLRAQASKSLRRRLRGADGNFVNLFKSRLINAHDHHPMHALKTGRNRINGQSEQRRLVSYGHTEKVAGSDPVSVSYDMFEASALRILSELNGRLLTANSKAPDLDLRRKELLGVEQRLAELQLVIEDPSSSSLQTVISSVASLEEKRHALDQEIRDLEVSLAPENSLAQSQEILTLLADAEPERQTELRLKLRSLIADIVDTIYIKPEKHLGRVYCLAQINFRNGGFKQFDFGPGFYGGFTEQTCLEDFSVDLRDKEACRRPIFTSLAEMLAEPGKVIIPRSVPEAVGPASEVWLKVTRSHMSKASFRVVPSKVKRFVEFLGDDLPCRNVNSKRWKRWTDHVKGLADTGELADATARVTWARSREFVRWLIEKQMCGRIPELDQSSFAAMGKRK